MAGKTKDPNKLFDFIDIMITKPKIFKSLKTYEKARHYFMVNRFCSIQYPVQANHLQKLKINPTEAINFWHTTLTSMYTRVPSWLYVKTSKSKKAAASKKSKNLSDVTISAYCTKFDLSKRDVYKALDFFGDSFIAEIKKFEKIINQ